LFHQNPEPNMSPARFIAQVVQHRELAPDVFEKTFRVLEPADFRYEAGNYASVKVADGKQPLVFRAYTFASAPNESREFKLCVKVFHDEKGEPGRGGGYLHSLKVGDKAEFFGPAGEGSFVPKLGETAPLLLFGTGTGIAPLKALTEKLTQEKSSRKITLFLGVSYPEDIFYEEEFGLLKQQNINFDYKIAVSRPPEGYAGFTGRLPAVLDQIVVDPQSEVFICGSAVSAKGIKDKLLELGLPEENIDAEGFGEV
jgi:Na+-transporting NADH:ubiquinone oxidoreductase subunit F